MMSINRSLVYGAVVAALGFGSAALAGEGHGHAPHWGYAGAAGPAAWGALDTNFKTCSVGKEQSPIDLKAAKNSELADVEIHYSEAPLNIVNNGHTIQVNFPEGNYATIGGVKYNLLQYHFHTTSEHTLDGQSFPLEAHLVHKTDDGKLGVIGVFMKEGAENPALAAVWENMPKEAGTVEKADIKINPAQLLPTTLTYYNYAGSLTTPPCSEGVNWMVMTTPVEVSSGQVQAFAAIFPQNNRPVQALNERTVLIEQ